MKHIIIIGPACSGKSRKALELLKGQSGKVTRFADGRIFTKRFGLGHADDADVLLIDDIPDLSYINLFSMAEGFNIERIHDIPLFINPQLILTFDEKVKLADLPAGEAFARRYDIIDLTPVTND